MSTSSEATIDKIYDDLTVEIDTDQPYFRTRPTFRQFSGVYERLAYHWQHNADLGNWRTIEPADGPEVTTTKQLRVVWQGFKDWYDVQAYMEGWIEQRLPETD